MIHPVRKIPPSCATLWSLTTGHFRTCNEEVKRRGDRIPILVEWPNLEEQQKYGAIWTVCSAMSWQDRNDFEEYSCSGIYSPCHSFEYLGFNRAIVGSLREKLARIVLKQNDDKKLGGEKCGTDKNQPYIDLNVWLCCQWRAEYMLLKIQ